MFSWHNFLSNSTLIFISLKIMEEGANRKKEWEFIENKEVNELFEILTGKLYYPNRQFTKQQIQPDLILRWRVPEEKSIKRSQFESVSAYVTSPPHELEQAFDLAIKKIMDEMSANKENRDNKQVQFRFMQSLHPLQQPQKKKNKVIFSTGGDEELEFMCYDTKDKTLDGFTLNFNSMMYMLQRVCGLRVRAFMVYNQVEDKEGFLAMIGAGKLGFGLTKKKVKDIYLFLNLSIENMLKVAGRFEVKKQLDYSFIDFFLNDPTDSQNRPIKYNTRIKMDKTRKDEIKHLSRYFKIKQTFDVNTDINDQAELSLLEQQKFQSYWEEMNLILDFFRVRVGSEISNEEKIYLYEYNRGKLNHGCEEVLSLIKKRRQFYEILKDVCQKYDYPFYDQPVFYEEFLLPNKKSKGGFFQKLKSMLVYKPNHVTPFGDLGLFLSMERIKLCYLIVKFNFKINYLEKMGIDILALNNDFEKFGDGGEDIMVPGGLDDTCLTDRWYMFALFSDIKTIRNYFGDVVAHQIMIRIAILGYLLIISVPYAVLYIFQILYTDKVFLYTTMIETGLFAISFSMFALLIEEMEDQFIHNFSDKRQSTVFLNSHRGPYIRNILTDELNQFEEERGLWVFFKNFFCLLIFITLGVMFGAIFYGCRALLLQIQPSLYNLQGQYLSLSHILAYSIYFILGDIFKIKLYGKVVRLMIWIKNPSSDQTERALTSYFTFYYLLVLECVPIFFFFILEPFLRTSCFSASCDQEFYNYIYARFLFNLAMAGMGLINAILSNLDTAKAKLLNAIEGEKKSYTFHDKLSRMIKDAVEEANKDTREDELTKDLLAIFAYSFYCSELAISGLIALSTLITIYVVTRINLLYDLRRPINKSQSINRFSVSCNIIYLVGVLINIWLNTYVLKYVEKYYIFIIGFAPKPLTENSVFLIEVAFTAFFFIVITALGMLARQIAIAFSPKGLINRQKNKYKQYIMMVAGPKTSQNKPSEASPLKSIFRTFNPERTQYEQLMIQMQKYSGVNQITGDIEQLIQNQGLLKGSGRSNLKQSTRLP